MKPFGISSLVTEIHAPVVFRKVFVSPKIDIISSFLRAEKHFQPKLFQIVIVVGPTRLEHFVPGIVCVQLVSFVQTSQILNL